MRCPRCGTHQSPKAFCGWCGQRLEDEPLIPTDEIVVEIDEEE